MKKISKNIEQEILESQKSKLTEAKRIKQIFLDNISLNIRDLYRNQTKYSNWKDSFLKAELIYESNLLPSEALYTYFVALLEAEVIFLSIDDESEYCMLKNKIDEYIQQIKGTHINSNSR